VTSVQGLEGTFIPSFKLDPELLCFLSPTELKSLFAVKRN